MRLAANRIEEARAYPFLEGAAARANTGQPAAIPG